MTYKETLEYLYRQLPMFHRVGAAAYKADLDNTIAICKRLGNPEHQFRSIHIAGTNGKGSTSHMLAAILQSAGYKTGLYTSPHLKDFRERIRINGKKIPQAYVTKFVQQQHRAFEKIKPSFFEWTVGLAFDYFAKEKVDIAVIEVGLGGRLDSTNVITPLVSLITNISYDHQNLLGNTLPLIAAEKAGIIKAGVPAIVSETQPEVKSVFVKAAQIKKTALLFADEQFSVRPRKDPKGRLLVDVRQNGKLLFKNLSCELPGLYQQKNIAGVLQAVEQLRTSGLKITAAHVRKGIGKVSTLTGLLGRWQTLSKKPLTIADTGHNQSGIAEVLKMIKATPHRQLHFVLGVVSDKDIRTILRLLPAKATYYFCKARLPRALDAHELAATARVYKLKGEVYPSVRKALKAAQAAAGSKDLVFVGGSTFTVAEAI